MDRNTVKKSVLHRLIGLYSFLLPSVTKRKKKKKPFFFIMMRLFDLQTSVADTLFSPAPKEINFFLFIFGKSATNEGSKIGYIF